MASASPRGGRTKGPRPATNGANLGFEAKLWEAADILRGSMDAAEYKHVVLGLVFLKYISDAYEEHRAKLAAAVAEYADPGLGRGEGCSWLRSWESR